MTTAWKPPGPGALDDLPWPDKLAANAVDGGRLHGYEVTPDLAQHYSHSDILYLGITGELPDATSARTFEFALAAFATMSVREAPTHVAVLSRICAAHLSSALGGGLVVLAESARQLIAEHAPFLAWLCDPSQPMPATFTSNDGETTTLIAAATARGLAIPTLHASLTSNAARLTLLYASGVTRPEHMEAAIIAARYTGLVAEALLATPDQLKLYPVKLPPYHYVPREESR